MIFFKEISNRNGLTWRISIVLGIIKKRNKEELYFLVSREGIASLKSKYKDIRAKQ